MPKIINFKVVYAIWGYSACSVYLLLSDIYSEPLVISVTYYRSWLHLFLGLISMRLFLIFCVTVTYWKLYCLWRWSCQSVLLELSFCLYPRWANSPLRKLYKGFLTLFILETVYETFNPFSFLYLQRNVIWLGEHIAYRVNIISSNGFQ